MKMSIGRKLGVGFALVSLLTVCSAVVTYWKISDIRGKQEAMVDVRIPSLQYSQDLIAQLNEASSKGREYILTADDHETAVKARDAFEVTQKQINLDLQKLREVSPRFVLQANRDRVSTLAERSVESNRLMSEIFHIRLPNNSASEVAAAKYMSGTTTPYNRVTKDTALELVDSLRQRLPQF